MGESTSLPGNSAPTPSGWSWGVQGKVASQISKGAQGLKRRGWGQRPCNTESAPRGV